MRVLFLSKKKLKQNVLLGSFLVLTLALLTVFLTQQPQTQTTITSKMHPVYKVKTDEQVVALTFDISWGKEIHEPVADILAENDLQCTFFLSGPWAKENTEYVNRLIKDGHEIASHGHRHIDLDKQPVDTIKEEILTAHNTLKEITGKEVNLIRVPNGAYNDNVINTAKELNYSTIQWSVDSLDWKKPGEGAIIDRVLRLIEPGSIILMHASDSCPDTPGALPKVIEGIKDKGYQIITVSELLKKGPGTTD